MYDKFNFIELTLMLSLIPVFLEWGSLKIFICLQISCRDHALSEGGLETSW